MASAFESRPGGGLDDGDREIRSIGGVGNGDDSGALVEPEQAERASATSPIATHRVLMRPQATSDLPHATLQPTNNLVSPGTQPGE
jgi:hypothetical protein